MKKQEWLYEISFMRPILLVLLVSYHAFAPYCGAWSLPVGVDTNFIYKWLALFSRAFRLEAFVFVSGYIFAMQVVQKNKFQSVIELAKSKFLRLIIPCWIFGSIYWLLFKTASPLNIFTGIGHLWYLPCLFWCFIFSYVLFKKQYEYKYVLLGLTILASVSFLPLPLQLGKAMYYLLFFYMGGVFWKYTNYISKYATKTIISILSIIFIILLIGCNCLIEYNSLFIPDSSFYIKAILLSVNTILKVVLATTGIITLFLIASKYMQHHSLSDTIIQIGTLGYGVYIFHQFVLRWLYYHTSMSEVLGGVWLPWIGLISAVGISILLTILIRRTKIGRKLI